MAVAAPAIPISGNGPIPKIRHGSKIILIKFDTQIILIEKAASPQFIEGNRTIHYTLIIHNTSQSTVYDPIIINDNLKDDLFSDANITITNDGNLTCDVNTSDTD